MSTNFDPDTCIATKTLNILLSQVLLCKACLVKPCKLCHQCLFKYLIVNFERSLFLRTKELEKIKGKCRVQGIWSMCTSIEL